MHVEKETLDNGHVLLNVEATVEEVDKAFDLGLEFFAEQVGLPKEDSKTPLQQLEMMFGDRSKEAVADAIMNFLLPFALDISKEVPVVSPNATPKVAPEQGKPFTFSVDIYPKPDFELSSYDPVTVVVENNPVTEEDIDQQMLMIAQNATSMQPDIITGEMKRVTPEITDDWVNKNIPDPDITSVATLRERLRIAGASYKEDELEQQKMNAAVHEMTKRFIGEIPSEIVESMTSDMLIGMKAQVASQRMDFQEYLKQVNMTEDQIEYQMELQAKQMLQEGFTLDAVFRHANLEIDESDLAEAITSMAPGNEEETKKRLEETGRMFALDEAAQRIKAGKWILENAQVTVK